MGVYQKLMYIQSRLKAPKGQYNSHGKYSYRSCEDIVEAVKPLLSEQGAVLLLQDGMELIGNRYYVRATVELVDTETGEKVQACAYAREAETRKGFDESQITGAASSYARKYALNGLFAIDDTKDADSYQNTDTAQQGAMDEASMRQALVRCFRKNNWDINSLLGQYNRRDISEMTAAECRDYINMLGRNGVNAYE